MSSDTNFLVEEELNKANAEMILGRDQSINKFIQGSKRLNKDIRSIKVSFLKFISQLNIDNFNFEDSNLFFNGDKENLLMAVDNQNNSKMIESDATGVKFKKFINYLYKGNVKNRFFSISQNEIISLLKNKELAEDKSALITFNLSQYHFGKSISFIDKFLFKLDENIHQSDLLRNSKTSIYEVDSVNSSFLEIYHRILKSLPLNLLYEFNFYNNDDIFEINIFGYTEKMHYVYKQVMTLNKTHWDALQTVFNPKFFSNSTKKIEQLNGIKLFIRNNLQIQKQLDCFYSKQSHFKKLSMFITLCEIDGGKDNNKIFRYNLVLNADINDSNDFSLILNQRHPIVFQHIHENAEFKNENYKNLIHNLLPLPDNSILLSNKFLIKNLIDNVSTINIKFSNGNIIKNISRIFFSNYSNDLNKMIISNDNNDISVLKINGLPKNFQLIMAENIDKNVLNDFMKNAFTKGTADLIVRNVNDNYLSCEGAKVNNKFYLFYPNIDYLKIPHKHNSSPYLYMKNLKIFSGIGV